MAGGLQGEGAEKIVVCNADEGDPGAFMDRSLLEGDPHAILEGMLVAGFAIGASQGYVYVRAEYPLAVERLEVAIRQAREWGLLGPNVMGTPFAFDVEIRIGAGAFVCGEETALMHSVEGKRGEPRQKPPFPFERGIFGKPTIINNVETLANVPVIVRNGGAWFASLGTPKSSGTKVFALAGKIENTGIIEVPMGITLGEVVHDIAGGIPKGKRFKAAQTGGPSGGCLTREHLNTPIDYDSLVHLGTIMGSGGLIVMDEDSCMVDVARFFLDFVQDESCGKCVPCRIGTKRMLEILTRITKGQGKEGDIDLLEELAATCRETSTCGLGQTAGNPVLSTIRLFREEYEEHIRDKHCRAGVCSDLFKSPCQNACPAGVDVPGYLALIAAGRPRDAYYLVRRENPFPAICGRVCTHPCEDKCRRAQLDEPVAICDLKRYAADYVFANDEPHRDLVFPKKAESVGVIGAGPSGLTCAYYLARLGYGVTVYESLPVAGGMLASGIPEYRLPKEVLAKETRLVEQVGVKIQTGVEVGKDVKFEELQERHQAIYVATGTQFPNKAEIPGEDKAGIFHGVSFLREANLGRTGRDRDERRRHRRRLHRLRRGPHGPAPRRPEGHRALPPPGRGHARRPARDQGGARGGDRDPPPRRSRRVPRQRKRHGREVRADGAEGVRRRRPEEAPDRRRLRVRRRGRHGHPRHQPALRPPVHRPGRGAADEVGDARRRQGDDDDPQARRLLRRRRRPRARTSRSRRSPTASAPRAPSTATSAGPASSTRARRSRFRVPSTRATSPSTNDSRCASSTPRTARRGSRRSPRASTG